MVFRYDIIELSNMQGDFFMIRQSAFTKENKMLKGGLHCHTTRSDGKCTPEETLILHKENGYDFLALTDHRKYNYAHYAPETGITLIPGMEIDGTFDRENGFRTYHTVCIGSDGDSNGFSQDEEFICKDVKSDADFQKYLDAVVAKNNLIFYCHPEWSGTPARYFENLKGYFAMEIWNSGCVIENDMDKNAPYWDEMLGNGHKLWGVAVDDGHEKNHHCKGWVMVNAENSVDSILDALKNGSFYSSAGPVIEDFYIEDGKAYVKASEECSRIWFCADKHPSKQFCDVSEASFDMNDGWTYVRAVVMDKNGNRAWTNPIFIK